MMKHLLFLAALIVSLPAVAHNTPYADRVRAYVDRYKDWAQEEQLRSGVPAAITLAQGVFETDAGASELAVEANNHFGIKCKKEWTGATFAHDDDAPQECFRKYGSAIESYRDHSDYLKSGKRYQTCFALRITDYAGWARELRRCGYATNPVYAQKLIKIIEDYNLQDYTLAALTPSKKAPVMIASAASPVAATLMAEEKRPGEVVPDRDTPVEEHEYGKVVRKNGLKGFWARSGDVLLEYAIQHKVRYAKLLEINGLPDAPLAKDQFIYLEKGSTVERMMAKDVSAPTLEASITAPPPAVAEASPAAATTTSNAVASTEPIPVSVRTETLAAPVSVEPKVTTPPVVKETASPVKTAQEKPYNIATEVAVEEQKPVAEPQDEFSRMKARFDKVVYAPTKPASTPAGSAVPTTPQPETPTATEPAKEKAQVVAAGPSYHTVKAGETAFGIAKNYGISMQSLMDLNKLSFGTSIKVGQKLRVK